MNIYNENCLDTMKNRIADNTIDLTVTSPPYDDIRTYTDNIDTSWGEHIWKPIISELYRITKPGGVVVWVVGDGTTKTGSETLSSFKQALWATECGFNQHDTMIYQKGGQGANGSNRCYLQDHEYMFVWSKGRPTTTNLIYDRKSTMKTNTYDVTRRRQDGTKVTKTVKKNVPEYGRRYNIWKCRTTGKESARPEKSDHPASFPDALCKDHIISWSNENDLVYDPFMGSGTTARICIHTNRKFIGSELSTEYFNLAKKLINMESAPLF